MKFQEAEHRAEAAELQAKVIQSENDRKTKELEEARELQLSMLPKDLPNLPNLDIAVYMRTATEVGGDYYDFHVGLDGTLTVVVGDATGHGMKAGTMVTTTKSLFNILAPNPDILATFSDISRVIKGMKFHQLSMCLMLLKIKGDQLIASSAAMPPALIYRNKNNAVEEIFMKGMPLGAMNDFPYSVKESHLEKGDTILMISDGLPELTNDNKEMYGYDRTKTEFHSVGEREPEEIVEHLKNSASQWVNDKDPDDDVTFVVIKVK
jgi:serine phosphatase RsbU (regulator of sigma subunit)